MRDRVGVMQRMKLMKRGPIRCLGPRIMIALSRARSSEFFIFPLLYLVLQHGDTEQCGLMGRDSANERAN